MAGTPAGPAGAALPYFDPGTDPGPTSASDAALAGTNENTRLPERQAGKAEAGIRRQATRAMTAGSGGVPSPTTSSRAFECGFFASQSSAAS